MTLERKGVAENCIFLDSPQQAKRFHNRMLNKYLQLGVQETKQVSIAIVGAGATGVELSAELYNSLQQVSSYGFEEIKSTDLKVTLVEAGDKNIAGTSGAHLFAGASGN